MLEKLILPTLPNKITVDSLKDTLLLNEEQIVKGASPAIGHTGVYFLIKNDKVVYVGQSTHILSRIGNQFNYVDYDNFAFIMCRKSELNIIESLYIHAFRPIKNGNNTHGGAKAAPLSFNKIVGLLSNDLSQ